MSEKCVSCETPEYMWGPLCSDSGEKKCIACCYCDSCHIRYSKLEAGEIDGAKRASFRADARELYRSDPKELLKLAINEGLECMYCGGSSFHEPFATPYSKATGGATIYYPCSCGETQVVVTDKKWGAEAWTDTEKHTGVFLEDLSRRGREAYMKLSPQRKEAWKAKWKNSGRPKGQRTRFTDLLGAESFAAPTGYNESGPRPFYGNARKMALDRWGNRRFIRRRKNGTYMKNVDVGRSLAMDRRRKSTTWAPAGFRDQGDGSPSLLMKLLDMFKGVDETVLMAESELMCAGCDDYSSECGCFNSQTDAYAYAYNDGHGDARRNEGYNPSTSDREITSFKKIFKQ